MKGHPGEYLIKRGGWEWTGEKITTTAPSLIIQEDDDPGANFLSRLLL